LKSRITAVLTAALLVLAATPAAADYGDWTTQRNKIESEISSEWLYWDSYPIETTHSRRFNYRNVYYINGVCYADYWYAKISHSYVIWDRGIFATRRWC
jgi:hypothetical protein